MNETAHHTKDGRPRHPTFRCEVCGTIDAIQRRKDNDPDWYKARYKDSDPTWLTELVKQEQARLDEYEISASNPYRARRIVMVSFLKNRHTTVRCNVDKARITEQIGPSKQYLSISDFVTDCIERHIARLEKTQAAELKPHCMATSSPPPSMIPLVKQEVKPPCMSSSV